MNKTKENPPVPKPVKPAEAKNLKELPKVIVCNPEGSEASGSTLLSELPRKAEDDVFVYKLSNGNYGVLFKDSSKIIISKDMYQFYYLHKQIVNGKSNFKASLHDFKNLPKCLQSSMKSILKSLSVLSGNQDQAKEPEDIDESFFLSQNIVYLTKFGVKSSNRIFKLSNQVIQIIFEDSTEIIFNEKKNLAVILTKDEQILKADVANNFHSYFCLAKHNAGLSK